jgi:hypothetical protein
MNHGKQGENGVAPLRMKNEYIPCDKKWWPPSNLMDEDQD